jgi:hypothetical protein
VPADHVSLEVLESLQKVQGLSHFMYRHPECPIKHANCAENVLRDVVGRY